MSDFLVFCIENYKVHRSLTGREVFALFKEYGVLEYILQSFETLHSTGINFINTDIDEFLSLRGYTI